MAHTPRGLLFDYGGTLVEEVRFDIRKGNEWLVSHGHLAPGVTLSQVMERAERVSREVSERRDVFHIETPWVSLTRLIHDALGTRFDIPLEALELGFWNAGVETRPMPGVVMALQSFRDADIPMGVVSNSSFRADVIRHELSKHGLDGFIDVFVASAEYVVRKPNPLGMEAAAGRLGLPCSDIWFVGDRLDTDIAGASAAGMTPVLFSRPAGPVADPPAITVTHWDELALLVRAATDS
jgi:FMN phosphatase YigB (HAD superfamily)